MTDAHSAQHDRQTRVAGALTAAWDGKLQKLKMRDASVDELGLQAAAGSPSA
jgi:hypothetical protein